MQNLCQWAMWSVLLWSSLTLEYSASLPKFEWIDPQTHEKLLCHKCPPGMSIVKPCTRDDFTECLTCDYGKYIPYWNTLDRCMYCNFPCGTLEVEVAPCMLTQNRVCECKPGYHAEKLLCIKHTKCPPGSGVVQHGNPREDTQCSVCPEGSFSSKHSIEETCQTHRNCDAEDLRVNVPGTIFHDAYCTACRTKKDLEVGLGTGVCLKAALDFVPFQLKSPRRLQQLHSQLTQIAPGTEKKKPIEELQVDLHNHLFLLKRLHGRQQAWNMVQVALTKLKLERILQNVLSRFSVV
ncbi:tumor necrosis factor receptor superfamily member 6B [Pantherophis guttatus]|uniref:Tumor necrosis factor receptor superfamily member 6B n=1 Tax=Pantherophis guttatus TaxID=94885 RepID=A0ABM3YWL7_PANGU|nr:tumor necrosis factor receptor superfamily member 6B [Pantherophis guttatus]XP_060540533.1 tumor necrosis factor receptor superfamily member 6B [Pantherophis guttatus]XP_060540534.1 tumor necrosis factor receptor superfamily member 6B [Pantherophis guttatus]